ncbi:glyoxalase [Altererythrobacter sp. SALINAS58]|uniref:VOC family protein n=1 Tax=Alteripontixanthobacter muriae TaxID=2705546 RepID=UPI001576408F|nr:VOC family protein [Alteripontixanthobacter muriae]NTZ43345.1 glyoxalase [Alteripontixanthobacter muriae]
MKLDHIVLLVGSLDRSLAYYEALLPEIGFKKSRDHVWGNSDGVYIDIKEAAEPGEGYRRYGVGLNHLGFTAPSKEAVEAIAGAMSSRGFEVPEMQRLGTSWALFMKDPDGMRFEITYYG